MKKLIMATLLLLAAPPPGWAQKNVTTLPKEFRGVWIIADETGNECKRQDWKGVAASESDRLINITAKAREEWESGCTIKSVNTSRDSPPGARTSDINLNCGGEGMTWRSREIWHVQSVSNRKIFTVITLRTSDQRDDSGKKMRAPLPSGLGGWIYLECK